MFRKLLKKHKSRPMESKKTTGMEDTATTNKTVTAFAKQFFSGRLKASSAGKDIVDRNTKKRFQSSDAKVHHPLTNTTCGADQREEIVIRRESFVPTTFLEADEFFSFSIEERAEVPGFEPAVITPNSLDLTYVTYLSESIFSAGCESGVDELPMVMDSTNQELDIAECSYDTVDSTIQCDDQLCSICCISPLPFNRSPSRSCHDSRPTYDDDGSTSLRSNELDSFFDLSVLQNEQCSKCVKRTVV